MVLRPYGIVLDGKLELGLEMTVANGEIQEVRPHTGMPESWVASPPFFNAHSHMEYRGLQGTIHASDYWEWIRDITRAKAGQSADEVWSDTLQAAAENHASGVGSVFEHADRTAGGGAETVERLSDGGLRLTSTPSMASGAMTTYGLNGAVFREAITLNHPDLGLEVLRDWRKEAFASSYHSTSVTPHAPHTVNPAALQLLGEPVEAGDPNPPVISVHVAESPYERLFFQRHEGPIADYYRSIGEPLPENCSGPLEHLQRNGCLRKPMQIVHACDLDDSELDMIAALGLAVAHCPRSNRALGCPVAKVRRMVERGIPVGLGMDSPASSGPVDMFAEMRAALEVSRSIGEPLSAEQVLAMAGPRGIVPFDTSHARGLEPGWSNRLLKLQIPGAVNTEDLIERGHPAAVEWLDLSAWEMP